MMKSSPTTMAPLLIRNLITSIFFYADKSLLNLAENYKPLELIRFLLTSSFLFFLRVLPSCFPSVNPNSEIQSLKVSKSDCSYVSGRGGGAGAGDSGIARALSQLLSIISNLAVSSRKYEVVRSLTERLIDENHREGNEVLREVNRTVLSSAFARSLKQLEAAVGEQVNGGDGILGSGSGSDEYRLGRVLRAVRTFRDLARSRVGKSREEVSWSASSAEKTAAELLWLAQKLAACECVEEAVCRWAYASNLAWLSLSAEPRLQCSLVKISAYLFKQAKEMGLEEIDETVKEKHGQTKMKMLVTWLPLLCRASNGTDVPVLSVYERVELEKVLEEIIGMLEQDEEQEEVLSLWLHHFTFSTSSDWPNLHASYARWYTSSRKLLLLQ